MHAVLTAAATIPASTCTARGQPALRRLARREPHLGPPEFVDVNVLEHHIPGGMISNLRSQLQQQGALDRLDEGSRSCRACGRHGLPPLVTPTSQIIGIQSVLNVLNGERYGMVPQETRDYVQALHARRRLVDPKIARKILGRQAVTCRPADLLKPGLPEAAPSSIPS